MVPTYAEDGTHVLKVCQHHHQLVRVAHVVLPSEIEGTSCARLRRPIQVEPAWSDSARRALSDRAGDGR